MKKGKTSPEINEYLCEECGEIHEHEEFVFGSPTDYDCKKEKK